MPTKDVISSTATAPVERLSLSVDVLRADLASQANLVGQFGLPQCSWCFDASGE